MRSAGGIDAVGSVSASAGFIATIKIHTATEAEKSLQD
jgi:hypothetical protein